MYFYLSHVNPLFNIGIPHFIVLYFSAICRYCISYKLKVCRNPAPNKSVNTICPTAFTHFLHLYHILVILTIL